MLNKKKYHFNKPKLEFFGFIFSAGGVSVDPKKVTAIQESSDLQDPTEVRSLLGMANYCSRFIKDFASISAPLLELTRNETSVALGPRGCQSISDNQGQPDQQHGDVIL